MTVSYTGEVATCTGFGCFLKLLFRWRGSIYKLVWPDLLLFLGSYFLLSGVYRFALTEEQQVLFEQVARYCEKYGNLIPVSFVLGFYVSIVIERWWDQYRAIPWPDSIAVFVSANIQGQDEKGRKMRRTIMRYVCLTQTMVFTLISPRVKKRFPTFDHFVEAGLLLENEKEILEEMNRALPGYSKHSLPIVWAASIVTRARKQGKIKDDYAVKSILDQLNQFRGGCGLLTSYDRISIPLVYTQVVTIAVYSFFLSCIMGRQWLHPETRHNPILRGEGEKAELDLVFPIFTTLQFFFYMGWLKVAETLVNPFGDDDDDFEVSWMVDRNLQMSYLIVDEMHNNHPELLRDQYWEEIVPSELPHTLASEHYKEKEETMEGSTAKVEVTKKESEIVSPPTILHMTDSGLFANSPKVKKEPEKPIPEELTKPTEDIRNGEDIPSLKQLFKAEGNERLPSAKSNVEPDPDKFRILSPDFKNFQQNVENDNDSRISTTFRRYHSSFVPGRRHSLTSSSQESLSFKSRRAQTAKIVRSALYQVHSTNNSGSGKKSRPGSHSWTNMLKKVFSREKTHSLESLARYPQDVGTNGWSSSTINMDNNGSNGNIMEDVIPEVDENSKPVNTMNGVNFLPNAFNKDEPKNNDE